MIGNKSDPKGFTLIEMSVALAIFGLVSLAAMSVFIAVLRSHRHSSASQHIIDNVRFALEFVEREMRTGRRFSNESGGAVLRFCNDRGQITRYRVNAGRFERQASGSGCSEGSALYEALTGSEVTIANAGFLLVGESDTDTKQPRVTLTFRATSRLDPTLAFDMETTISQRDIDIKK